MYLIQLMFRMDNQEPQNNNKFLVSYDFENQTIVTSDEMVDAKTFKTKEEALEFYSTQSKSVPVRWWDGQPNRPLRIWSISVNKVSS